MGSRNLLYKCIPIIVLTHTYLQVTFKLGLGSTVVSDDLVKGVLKIGAQVKASHPEKNQYVDAIVNKIQDCSQYTVGKGIASCYDHVDFIDFMNML